MKEEFKDKRFKPTGPLMGWEYAFYIHDSVADKYVCGMNSMTPLVYACRAMNDWIGKGGGRIQYIEKLQSYLEEDHKKSQPSATV